MAGEFGDLRSYSEKLRTYSAEELEDIYFNIHILRHPLRYRLLRMEMERRSLGPSEDSGPARRVPDLRTALARNQFLAIHPWLCAAVLSITFFGIAVAVTLALFAPVWLFADPLHFVGLQTAIVYFAWAPIPPILGAAVAGRMGGRRWYAVATLLGVVAGLLLFNATGVPSVIIRAIVQAGEPGGSGGFMGF